MKTEIYWYSGTGNPQDQSLIFQAAIPRVTDICWCKLPGKDYHHPQVNLADMLTQQKK